MVDAACATVTLVPEFVNVGEGAPEMQRQLMEYVDGVAPCPLVLTGASQWGLTCALVRSLDTRSLQHTPRKGSRSVQWERWEGMVRANKRR
jgi:hypothetical protein